MVEAFYGQAAAMVEAEAAAGARWGELPWVRGLLETIRRCSHVLELSFPLRRDSGTWEVVRGWQAQHSQHRLPCKGGEAGSRGPTTRFSILTQVYVWGSAGLTPAWLGERGDRVRGICVSAVVVRMRTEVPRKTLSLDASCRRTECTWERQLCQPQLQSSCSSSHRSTRAVWLVATSACV